MAYYHSTLRILLILCAKIYQKIIPELHKRYCQLGYGGGYMMTHRQDILESFENAFRKKGMLMVLISQSFPNTQEEPVRKGLLLTGSNLNQFRNSKS